MALPPYVSVAPSVGIDRDAFGSGFLGPKYSPLIVGGNRGGAAAAANNSASFAELKVNDLTPPAKIATAQMTNRLELWKTLENRF